MSDVPEDIDSWSVLEQARWSGHPEQCPQCGARGRCYYLQPAAGSRRTRLGKSTARRIWKCGACRRQFSVLTGTVLEGTRVALDQWLQAIEEFSSGRSDLDRGLASPAARRLMEFVLAQVPVETSLDES